jgi:WD40 repeat protein
MRILEVTKKAVVNGLAFSPDRSRLAAAVGDRVRFWEADGWKEGGDFAPGVGFLRALAFSPDGKLAAAGGDGRVALWDVG